MESTVIVDDAVTLLVEAIAQLPETNCKMTVIGAEGVPLDELKRILVEEPDGTVEVA